MKIMALILASCLVMLAGCATAGSSKSADIPRVSIPNMAQASSGLTTVSSASPANLNDEDVFLAFLSDNFVLQFINFPVATIDDLMAKANAARISEMIVLYTGKWDDAMGIPQTTDGNGQRLIPIEHLQDVAQDMVGFRFDFAAFEWPGSPGYVDFPGGHGLNVAVAQEETVAYANGMFSVQAIHYPGGEGDVDWENPIGTAEYSFAYNPGNTYCAYTLLSVIFVS